MAQIRDEELLRRISVVLKQLREEKQLREGQNWSQENVYNEINIHIGRIETAKANLSVSTLSKLCKFLEIRLSEFFKRIEQL